MLLEMKVLKRSTFNQMTLLYNVYITQSPGNVYCSQYPRGNLKSSTKLDIAKYSLASLSVAYPWANAIINVELDSTYTHKDREALEFYITDLFKNTKLYFSHKRCVLQSEWQSIYSTLADFIFYLGNHDHIFMDSNNEYLQTLVNEAKALSPDQYATIATSHWPELVRWAKSGYIELHELNPRQLHKDYGLTNHYAKYKSINIDSLNIISKQLYYNWFFIGRWEGVELPRTDGIGNHSLMSIRSQINKPLPEQTIIVPYKEQLRHFDGYMHQRIDNNTCPALDIPTGFFECDIKVRYGYSDYKSDWVNINPTTQNYYATDKSGTDYKILLEDIPLFWKNRISKIDINSDINKERMIQYRLQTVLKMIYSDSRYNPYIEDEIQTYILNKHLNNYDEYSLL